MLRQLRRLPRQGPGALTGERMFKEPLRKIVDNVEGGIAGLVMGFDGIAVDSYTREGHKMDITTVGMEFSFILTQVRKATEILDVGSIQEISIKAENLHIVIRVLNPEYFLALALTPDGNFGKGRYLMRVVAPRLQAEL
jgi:predicted regulator of Ras-like GTPase activity (Roadblock/LC7/MglB family)